MQRFHNGSEWAIYENNNRSGSWTRPSALNDHISPSGQGATLCKVASDNNGNCIVIWQQSDGSNAQIFKSEYRSSTWTHPSGLTNNISPDGQDAASHLSVAMDNNGNAIIAWTQSDGSNNLVYMSEYRSGSWSHPANLSANISPSGANCDQVTAVMDNNGNAMIVWRQDTGSGIQIYKSEYRSGSWTHPTDLNDFVSVATTDCSYPDAAMDDNGNAIIIWTQADGTHLQIFKSEYRSGSWTHPSGLTDNISPDGSNTDTCKVAMDNDGNAIIAWRQYDASTDSQVFKSEYRSGSWTHPSGLSDNISPDGQNAYSIALAADKQGAWCIAWRQNNGSSTAVFLSEYRYGRWDHPADLNDSLTPGWMSINKGPYLAMSENKEIVLLYAAGSTYVSEFR